MALEASWFSWESMPSLQTPLAGACIRMCQCCAYVTCSFWLHPWLHRTNESQCLLHTHTHTLQHFEVTQGMNCTLSLHGENQIMNFIDYLDKLPNLTVWALPNYWKRWKLDVTGNLYPQQLSPVMNQQPLRNCEICHGFPECARSSYLYFVEEISHNKTHEQLAPARIVSIAVDVQYLRLKNGILTNFNSN